MFARRNRSVDSSTSQQHSQSIAILKSMISFKLFSNPSRFSIANLMSPHAIISSIIQLNPLHLAPASDRLRPYLPLRAWMEMKFLLFAVEKEERSWKNDKRRKSEEISYSNKKGKKWKAKPTTKICMKIFVQQSDTERKNAGGAIGLSSEEESTLFPREDEQPRPFRSNWVKLPIRPNHIVPQRALEPSVVCSLRPWFTPTRACFLCYSANFFIFRMRLASLRRHVSAIHLISSRIWYHSDIHFHWCRWAFA